MVTRVRVLKELDSFVETLVKEVTIDTTEIVSEKTPVDTGWAQTNWIPSVGVAYKETAGTRQQAEGGLLFSSVKQGGINSVRSNYSLRMGNTYVTNNVPYILSLNAGSSAKAPVGFVQNAISAAIFKSLRRTSR